MGLNYFRNELVGLLGAPLIDGVGRTVLVGEIQVGYLGLIVPVYIRLVAVQQYIILVHYNGIGNGQSGLFVQRGELLQHGQGVLVHGIHLTGTVAQYLTNFIGRLPLRPVQNNSQQELQAKRRNDKVLLGNVIHPIQQVESKGVTLLRKLGRFRAQIQGLVGVVRRIVLVTGHGSCGQGR